MMALFMKRDSSDIAFQLAGSFAFKDAFEKASPYLLEPIYEVEVFVTLEHTGDVISDINGRRGRVQGVEDGVVRALVPQSEMYKYSTSLRSHTQGRGSYTMKFSHYEQVPAHLYGKDIRGEEGRINSRQKAMKRRSNCSGVMKEK